MHVAYIDIFNLIICYIIMYYEEKKDMNVSHKEKNDHECCEL